MAFIKCPECRKKVSDKAVVCFGCGCRVENISTDNMKSTGRKGAASESSPSGCLVQCFWVIVSFSLLFGLVPFIGSCGRDIGNSLWYILK